MKTIIICCNYNEGRTGNLERCLTYLQQAKLPNTIVGIIDNASKDNSKDIIDKYKANNVIDYVLMAPKNFGKAKGLNMLFKQLLTLYDISSQDLVLHIDSDIAMYKNYIKDAEYCFKTYPNCQLFISNGSSILNEFKKDNLHIFDYNKLQNTPDNNYQFMPMCPGICGCIWTMKVWSFCYVNYYRENLGKNGTSAIYGGDDGLLNLDLLQLFKYTPASVYLNPNEYHYHPKTNDIKYQEWKNTQNALIAAKLFNNDQNADDELAGKGFFD